MRDAIAKAQTYVYQAQEASKIYAAMLARIYKKNLPMMLKLKPKMVKQMQNYTKQMQAYYQYLQKLQFYENLRKDE